MTHSTAPVGDYSFEFFPPKTDEGIARLNQTREALTVLGPKFFSVTFGAGGSTQDRTFETVQDIQQNSPIEAAPHLSCIGSTREGIRQILNNYRSAGIQHIVALRGDLPSGMGDPGEFRYANELVAFIREETGDDFHIEVAAYPEYHPQARTPNDDLQRFVDKVSAGADSAITQFFYNADAYFRFVDDAAAKGVTIPIVPGIMPINNFSQLARFADACGAEIPRWVRLKMNAFGDDSHSIKAFGVDLVTDLCERLLRHDVPGLHFYTLNRAEPSVEIWKRLGIAAA